MRIMKPIKPKELYKKAFFLGLILSALFFLPYVIAGRGYFTYLGDFNVQQIPFYKLAHEAVRKGEFGWDFYTDLGANFVSSYSFYLLGSPFFWLTLPFPTDFLPYLMAPLLCLKFAVASLTAYTYITRFVRNKNLALLGGLLYAFSGYSMYNIFFNHFHDCIALFPLLLIALEEYMENGKKGFFAFAVCINAMTNYFFFFGEVIFLIIYFIARMSTGEFKLTTKKFFTLAFESVIGFLMSIAILLPAIMGILSNPRVNSFGSGWGLMMYNNPQKYFNIIFSFFFPPELPHMLNFFPDSGLKWKSAAGFFPIVGMVGVLAFMFSKKKNFIKRILVTCLIFAMIPFLNSFFYAFNTSYYARWFYMPILMMALATAIAFEDRKIKIKTGIRWQFGILLFFILALGILPNGNDEGKFPLGLAAKPGVFWVYAGVTVISFLVFLILYISLDTRKVSWIDIDVFATRIVKVVSVAVVVFGISYIGYAKSVSSNIRYTEKNGVSVREDDIVKIIEAKDTFVLPDDEDIQNQFYRVDMFDGYDNQGMFWKMPTIQAFQSVVPGSIMEFYPEVGVKRDVGSRPELSHEGLRPFLSVKFLFQDENSDKEIEYEGYTYYATQSGYDIYRYDNYIPMGFMYDEYMTENDFENILEENRDKALVSAILLDDEQEMKYGHYMDRAKLQDIKSMSYDDLVKSSMERKKQACSTFEHSSKGFRATINAEKAGLVFFSVPYEDGFTAKVDGVDVDVEKINVGFMGVFVEEGEHIIEFNYKTPGLSTGLLISISALLILLIYIVISLFYNPEKKKLTDRKSSKDAQKSQRRLQREKQLKNIVDSRPKDEDSEVLWAAPQDL